MSNRHRLSRSITFTTWTTSSATASKVRTRADVRPPALRPLLHRGVELVQRLPQRVEHRIGKAVVHQQLLPGGGFRRHPAHRGAKRE